MTDPVVVEDVPRQVEPASKRDSHRSLFLRFLGFGLRAWGGPAAQIAMLRDELVDQDKWMTSEQFNRTLAVYQVLPGPEATELCVHFGYLRRGRPGAIVAGLGFLLPGFLLMLTISMLYVAYGNASWWSAALIGFPPAVAALVLRATHRLGNHALHNRFLLLLGIAGMLATLLSVPFYLILPAAGFAYVMHQRGFPLVAIGIALAVAALGWILPIQETIIQASPGSGTVGVVGLAWAGFKAGMLTFGGAYTVIPFLQADAVGPTGWVTANQFVDAIALSGILPAPLIIFSTMLGYLGAGLLGALTITVAIFLPAFGFTLVGFHYFDRLVKMPRVHAFLDGVTAAVIGLIGATGVLLVLSLLNELVQLALFAVALAVLYLWKAKAATPVIVLGCGLLGALALVLLHPA